MTASLVVCVLAFGALIVIIRDGRPTLGLPVAYLYGLLLIHIPGAFVHALPWSDLAGGAEVQTGIRLTAIGAVAYVVGAWLGHRRSQRPVLARAAVSLSVPDTSRRSFWLFCLSVGWFVSYVVLPLVPIPSVSAALKALSGLWTLGVLLGLRHALAERRTGSALAWGVALLVSPVLTLVTSGFLSYGSAAVITCLCGLVAVPRRSWMLAGPIVVGTYLGLSLFVGYFSIRDDIRSVTWSAARTEERVAAVSKLTDSFAWFDIHDWDHAHYLDQRLNQNYFVGRAAERLQNGEADWFGGSSFSDGLLAFIPRVIWPDKPFGAGSGRIVADLTDLDLSYDSSFGVGSVLELYANFGLASLIGGFVVLGWILGRLDLNAATAEQEGRYRHVMASYLVAVALIQPNGSIVELTTGSAAAWVGAMACGWLWTATERWRARAAPAGASFTSPYPSAPL